MTNGIMKGMIMSAFSQQSARLKRPVLLAAALACLLPLSAPPPTRADAPKSSVAALKNSIVAIRSVVDGRRPTTYTITLTSTAEFPMTNSVVTLNIGGQEFINSSYAPGGSLNTLVFSLTRSQFSSLKSGAPVVVYYGADNAALPAAQWSFGALDLSLLRRVTPISPGPVKVTANKALSANKPVTAPAPLQQKGKK